MRERRFKTYWAACALGRHCKGVAFVEPPDRMDNAVPASPIPLHAHILDGGVSADGLTPTASWAEYDARRAILRLPAPANPAVPVRSVTVGTGIRACAWSVCIVCCSIVKRARTSAIAYLICSGWRGRLLLRPRSRRRLGGLCRRPRLRLRLRLCPRRRLRLGLRLSQLASALAS